MKTKLIVFFFFLSAHCFSQIQDVVYLKNGSVIHGKIISSSESIKIETKDNNIWVFKKTEIDSVKKEEFNSPKREIHLKEKGFYNVTTNGILAGRNSYRNLTSLSLLIVNGYRFSSGISMGLGMGIENMQIISAPLFAEVRYDILKKKTFSPFVVLQGGYAVPLQNNYGNYGSYYKGGKMLNPEIGFRSYFSNHTAITFSFGYRYQELHSKSNIIWSGEKIGTTETVTYFNRLSFRIGFVFD